MSEPEQLARIFKALAVESRVRIIQALRDRIFCVNALAGLLEISPPAVSQHLRVLRDAELVRAERRGYHVHYSLNRETLGRWRSLAAELLEDPGDPDARPRQEDQDEA